LSFLAFPFAQSTSTKADETTIKIMIPMECITEHHIHICPRYDRNDFPFFLFFFSHKWTTAADGQRLLFQHKRILVMALQVQVQGLHNCLLACSLLNLEKGG